MHRREESRYYGQSRSWYNKRYQRGSGRLSTDHRARSRDAIRRMGVTQSHRWECSRRSEQPILPQAIDVSKLPIKPASITRLDLSRLGDTTNSPARDYSGYPSNFNTEIFHHYDETKNTILIGQSGLGKTSLASWMFNHRVLIIDNILQLSGFNRDKHDAIIFREVDFSQLKFRELDILTSRSSKLVTINKTEILIPSITNLIFTTTRESGHIFPTPFNTLTKRFQKFRVTRPTYIESMEDDTIINITP